MVNYKIRNSADMSGICEPKEEKHISNIDKWIIVYLLSVIVVILFFVAITH